MYSKTVQKIHHEFNTAGDKLLAEAKEILSKGNTEKAKRLERAGFVKAKEVVEIKHLIMSDSVARTIQYFQQKYPFNKFITKDKVEEINKKYNLVCGPVRVYKGFVPENKLAQIESFSLKSEDIQPDMIEIVTWSHSHKSNLHAAVEAKYLGRIIPATDFYETIPSVRINGDMAFVTKYNKIKAELMICAPAKDMDLTGLKKAGSIFSQMFSVEVKDPIVLQPVKGGFLVVAAWGDEASDKDLVNQIEN